MRPSIHEALDYRMAEADGRGCAFQQASSGVFILMPGSTMPPRFPISVPPQTGTLIGLKPGVKTIAAVHSQCLLRVKTRIYRTAALLSASPQ